MISEESLNKCIDKLATINANTNSSSIKQLTVEVGYVLKEELDIVKAWNSQFDGKSMPQIDVKKLIQDNSQLAHENAKLQSINDNLVKIIEQQIPVLDNKLTNIRNSISKINQTINIL